MLGYLVRRIGGMLVVLFCVISLTFFLVRMLEGGPFDTEREPPPHIKQELLDQYGLGDSIWVQYGRYMRDLILKGDLRMCFHYRDWTVAEVLAQKLPASLQIGAVAFVLASIGGVAMGALAAMRRNTPIDYGVMLFALLAVSVPTFVTGPILIGVFALWLGWLPVGGWLEWRSLVLPSICLAAPYLAYVARLTRNSMLDVLRQDFIRTAHAKGLPASQVIIRHALKPAILPVVGFLGPLAAHLLTGAMVVEAVFNISGAGSIFVNSILNRDGFLLGGVVIVYCTLLIVFNLICDLTLAALDSRIRLNE